MHIFRKSVDLRNAIHQKKQNGLSVGFVPTMGALHPGHLSLLDAAKENDQITVCSIFVNPTQFNDPADLNRYPRTIEADLSMLEATACDFVFLPEVKEIYPDSLEQTPDFDFGELDLIMEGAFRPGHFKGVAQVVHKFLEIIECDHLYLGQKDFQQVAIIKSLIENAGFKSTVKVCPTIREKDGLAMSSRNMHLTEQERAVAPHIYQALNKIKTTFPDVDPLTAKKQAIAEIEKNTGGSVEYLEIMDTDLTKVVTRWDQHQNVVACIAVKLGKVRLIDNLIIF